MTHCINKQTFMAGMFMHKLQQMILKSYEHDGNGVKTTVFLQSLLRA
ncbi:hypothetical protein HPTD01_1866 [Halomonas sp. TD01]|nr:hypothetical protein HPTD01_1866 [Halomonas sp. TD01]